MKHIWRKYGLQNILAIILGGVIIGSSIFFILRLFTIRHIEVIPPIVTVSIDSSQLPSNLLLFPGNKLRSYILQEYPNIKDVQFIKKYPSTLEITVDIRKPIAILEDNGRRLAIDDEYVLFESSSAASVTHIDFPSENMIPGEKATGINVVSSIDFLKKIGVEEEVKSITMNTNNTLKVTLKDTTVLLSNNDTVAEADTLQTLLKGFRMKGSVPRIIDLRFSKPIITP